MSSELDFERLPKGVFIHPCIRSYRVGFFNELHTFFELDVIESSYPKSGGFVHKDREDSISKLNFSPIKQTKKKFLRFDTSVFNLFSSKYEFVIYSSFISFPFLFTALFAKLLGKKVIVFDELWEYPTTSKFKILRFIFKFFVNFTVDGFILAGSKSYEFNKRFFPKIKNRVIAYNTNSYYKSSLCVKPREDSILYLGRVVKIKGLDKLIQILPNLDMDLIVVGGSDIEYKKECIEAANKLGVSDRISFLGECKKSDTSNIYSKYSIFCLPSQFIEGQSQQLESWGFTVNEALECGCKVLVSDKVGSASDLIINGFNGYIFDSEDLNDFKIKAQLITLINTSPEEIKENLMEKCDHYKNSKVMAELINVILAV